MKKNQKRQIAARGSKGRLTKAAGAEVAGQMRDEKLNVVMARSTFGSKKYQNTSDSEYFWKLSYGKSTRHYDPKYIWKTKVAKDLGFGVPLEDKLWEKYTSL